MSELSSKALGFTLMTVVVLIREVLLVRILTVALIRILVQTPILILTLVLTLTRRLHQALAVQVTARNLRTQEKRPKIKPVASMG